MITLGNDKSGAIFSDDKRYRYRLWRVWNHELPRCCCIMLNPSTADEIDNDPTIERRVRHVKRWMERGYRRFGSVEIVNVFAWRSTVPEALYKVADPIGKDNDASIRAAVETASDGGGLVICGWGGHAARIPGADGWPTRHGEVCEFLEIASTRLAALRLNADATPAHPLYLGYDLLPRWWRDDGLLGDIAV